MWRRAIKRFKPPCYSIDFAQRHDANLSGVANRRRQIAYGARFIKKRTDSMLRALSFVLAKTKNSSDVWLPVFLERARLSANAEGGDLIHASRTRFGQKLADWADVWIQTARDAARWIWR